MATEEHNRNLTGRLLSMWLCVLVISVQTAHGFATMQQIRDRGEIIVAFREAAPSVRIDDERLARQLGKHLGVDTRIIQYPDTHSALKALSDGKIDLLADPLSVQRPLPDSLLFTSPVRHDSLVKVARTTHSKISPKDASWSVQPGSDGWHYLMTRRETGGDFPIKILSSRLTSHELLQKIASDENGMGIVYRSDIDAANVFGVRTIESLDDSVALAWVMRSDDLVLKDQIEEFLHRNALSEDLMYSDPVDFEHIRQRGTIRMVTLYQPETSFIWNGDQFGLEFELAEAFADSHNLQLQIVLARSKEDLQQRLLRREADLGGAFLISENLDARLAASMPYVETVAHLVGKKQHYRSEPHYNLHQKTVAVEQGSRYIEQLRIWQNAGIDIEILTMPSTGLAEQLFNAIETGTADFAIIDDYQYRLEKNWRQGLKILTTLEQKQPRVWTVRGDNPSLLKQINTFWGKRYDDTDIRYLRKKYLQHDDENSSFSEAYRAYVQHGSFSPYDDWVRKYARYYNFDWRLILAVISQESRFDPSAISSSGAKGLMQVMDVSARQVGITNPLDPKSGIHAGVKYLDWIRNQLESDLNIRERIWLSLAAYNGGIGNIKRARREAVRMGLDPDRWFGQVEKATLALSRKPGRRFDGHQIINYVRRVRDYYESYVRMTEFDESAIARVERSGPFHNGSDTHTTRSTD